MEKRKKQENNYLSLPKAVRNRNNITLHSVACVEKSHLFRTDYYQEFDVTDEVKCEIFGQDISCFVLKASPPEQYLAVAPDVIFKTFALSLHL